MLARWRKMSRRRKVVLAVALVAGLVVGAPLALFIYWFTVTEYGLWWAPVGNLEVRLPDGGRLVYAQNVTPRPITFMLLGAPRDPWQGMWVFWTPPGGKERRFRSMNYERTFDPQAPGNAEDAELCISRDNRYVWVASRSVPDLSRQYLDLTREDGGIYDGLPMGGGAPDPDLETGPRPLGRRLELPHQLGSGKYQDPRVIWRALEATETTGTRIVVKASVLGGRWLAVQATDPVFYAGEWREDNSERLWMVDRRTPGSPKVRAALDREKDMFWDEKGILWRWNPPDWGKAKVIRASSTPQPYPAWATVTGGKSLTPWRVRPPSPGAGVASEQTGEAAPPLVPQASDRPPLITW